MAVHLLPTEYYIRKEWCLRKASDLATHLSQHWLINYNKCMAFMQDLIILGAMRGYGELSVLSLWVINFKLKSPWCKFISFCKAILNFNNWNNANTYYFYHQWWVLANVSSMSFSGILRSQGRRRTGVLKLTGSQISLKCQCLFLDTWFKYGTFGSKLPSIHEGH